MILMRGGLSVITSSVQARDEKWQIGGQEHLLPLCHLLNCQMSYTVLLDDQPFNDIPYEIHDSPETWLMTQSFYVVGAMLD